jgi:hypothetical protein
VRREEAIEGGHEDEAAVVGHGGRERLDFRGGSHELYRVAQPGDDRARDRDGACSGGGEAHLTRGRRLDAPASRPARQARIKVAPMAVPAHALVTHRGGSRDEATQATAAESQPPLLALQRVDGRLAVELVRHRRQQAVGGGHGCAA